MKYLLTYYQIIIGFTWMYVCMYYPISFAINYLSMKLKYRGPIAWTNIQCYEGGYGLHAVVIYMPLQTDYNPKQSVFSIKMFRIT